MSGRKATTNIIPGKTVLSVGKPDKPLPENWKWILLSDIAEMKTGHTPSRKVKEYWEEGDISWIAVGDARKDNGGFILETKQLTNQKGIDNSAAVLLPKHTVCLSRTASIGYCILTGKENMATSQGFVNWICSNNLNPRYLQIVFIAENQFLHEISEGTAHTTIYFPEAKAFNIAVPSKTHQDRIVAKVDALMAQHAAIQQAMERIPQLLKDFRQQVLTQAVTFNGTSTAKFRKIKDFKIEIKTGPFGSALHKSEYIDDGISIINPSHIHDGMIIPKQQVTISESKFQELNRWELKKGDVILGRRGEMGRSAVYKKEYGKMICGTGSLILKENKNVSAEFLDLYLRSDFVIRFLENNSVGSTMINLNQKIINSLPFPDVTKEDQIESISKLESLFEKATAIEQRYEHLKSQSTLYPNPFYTKPLKVSW